jgi:predicted DCC family thiol-disulfide oxidoreductase YuxK
MKTKVTGRNILLYDGACPFCSSVSRYYEIKEAFPGLEIISLRDADKLKTLGLPPELDFNLGMILIQSDGSLTQGAEALREISQHLSGPNWSDRLFAQLGRLPWVSELAYPLVFKAREWVLDSRRIPTNLPRVDLEN